MVIRQTDGLDQLLNNGHHQMVITTHRSPDGDAMGSALGLYHYLRRKEQSVTVITPNAWPQNLDFLPGTGEIINYDKQPEAAEAAMAHCKILWCLDFNNLSRLDGFEQLARAFAGPKVLIDHHQDPDSFYQFAFADTEGPSTCELIYQLIEHFGDDDLVDAELAACLYLGMLTDTGSFRYPSVTSETHRIVSQLLETGMHHSFIHEMVQDNQSIERMRLHAFAVAEKMEFFPEMQLAVIALSFEELKRHHYKDGDTEGLVNQGLALAGCTLSVILLEMRDHVKLSFRSKGDRRVDLMAREHFNGGGHRNAAGGRLEGSLQDALGMLHNAMEMNAL